MTHEIDYEILGDDMQLVEIALDPGETVIAEAGAMNYMDSQITFEAKMGDGSKPKSGFLDKALGAGKRLLTGESLFMTHFTNSGHGIKKVAFAAPYPGKIVPVDLSGVGGEFTCQKDAFLCAAMASGNLPSEASWIARRVLLRETDMFIRRRISRNGVGWSSTRTSIQRSVVRPESPIGFTTNMPPDCFPRASPPAAWQSHLDRRRSPVVRCPCAGKSDQESSRRRDGRSVAQTRFPSGSRRSRRRSARRTISL